MLAGEQLASSEVDDDAVTAELNDCIEGLVEATEVPTEPARRSLVPE